MLEKNATHLQRNVQSRKGFSRGLYGGREEQIVQRARGQNLKGGT